MSACLPVCLPSLLCCPWLRLRQTLPAPLLPSLPPLQAPAYFTGSEVRMRDPDQPAMQFAVAFKGASWTDPDSVPLMVMQASAAAAAVALWGAIGLGVGVGVGFCKEKVWFTR